MGGVTIIQSDPGWNTPVLPQFKQFQVDPIRSGTQRWGQAESEFGWEMETFPYQTQPLRPRDVARVIPEVFAFFPVPLFFFPSSSLLWPGHISAEVSHLGSHSVLSSPEARAVWWEEGMKDGFQRRSKDRNPCSHPFFHRASIDNSSAFPCSASADQ